MFDFGCMSVSSCFGCCVSKNGVCPTAQGVSVALMFRALFDPPSVLLVASVVLVFQQHKPKVFVCSFWNQRLVQHAPHHYTTKALDRPWSNAGVFDVLV